MKPRRFPVSSRHFIQALSLALALLAIPAVTARPALAQSGLVVTPPLVQLDLRTRSQTLTLVNRGNEAQTYRISVINLRMDPSGNMVHTEEPATGEGFAGNLIRYAPRQVTLEPGRPQTIRVLYRRPKDLADGEYRSHLLFQQVPKSEPAPAQDSNESGLTMQIRAVFGISVPVIVRNGQLEASGALVDARPEDLGDQGLGIAFTIEREGTKSLRGDLVATVDGQEVGRLNNVAVYLSTPSRRIVMRLGPEAQKSLSGKQVTVEYRTRRDEGAEPIAVATARMP